VSAFSYQGSHLTLCFKSRGSDCPLKIPGHLFTRGYLLEYFQPKLHQKLQLCLHCYSKRFSPGRSTLFQSERRYEKQKMPTALTGRTNAISRSTELLSVQAFMVSVQTDFKYRHGCSLLLEFLTPVIQIAECRKKLSCWDNRLFKKLRLFNSALLS